MGNERERSEASSFDLRYLKSITDDLQDEVKARGVVMQKMETHMATTNLILDQLKSTQNEHKKLIDEHSLRIHSVEITQAGCRAATRIDIHDRELKKLNAFMDIVKRDPQNSIDTGTVDTHAERIQHAAEIAIVNSLPVKLHLARSWPYIVIIAIFCIVITTLIMFRVATGQEVELPTINDVPGIGTNSSRRIHDSR